ncbi:probable phosphoglycerate mutase [Quadrisphaera granulorum]|uniref:Putative phosphoglycerate mutase n=1 Tax=Quadrisphaera granulorum TaxID=317664 RepID=A0A316A9V4_9ACTN|nr:histidine phosphatase family protein [Quadrisphaera granulorum]PWJ53978.1 putative phosphoglycerate mutase [Quadrisphaera granulorum]SZE96435.1 probable phosphoglycerate mutase [Quadrisphaera granulorum]
MSAAGGGASRLVLWRHGRTTSNAEGRFQGQLDIPLDEVGHAQARAAAEQIAAMRPDRLVSSDLSRARATAAHLEELTDLRAVEDRALRELHAGAWQGLLHRQIEDHWPEGHRAWRSGEDVRIGGGEKRSELGRRVAASLEHHAALTRDGGLLVAASHSGALRAGVLTLLGLPPEAWANLASIGNGRWAVVERRFGRWVLRGYDLGPRGVGEALEGRTNADGALSRSEAERSAGAVV